MRGSCSWRATSSSGSSSRRAVTASSSAEPSQARPSRDQEGSGDRTAHGEEPDQGLLRGARRRPAAEISRSGRHASVSTSSTRTSSSSRSPRVRRSNVGFARLPRVALRSPRGPARRGQAHDSLERGFSRAAPPSPRRSPEERGARCLERVCEGEAAFADSFAEAQQALLGSVMLKESLPSLATRLSAYKYTPLRVAVEGGVRHTRSMPCPSSQSTTRSAVPSSWPRSRSSFAVTLHPARRRRRSTSIRTRFARLRRIGELSGLDLRRDDWLLIEIAVKMVKLQQALGAAKAR